MKDFLKKILSNDLVSRALHTFVQAFLAALLVSATSVSDLNTAKAALLAAAAAGISAAKTTVLARK